MLFSEDRLRAVEAGMNEHLAKPLESTVIIKTIAKYLKRRIIKSRYCVVSAFFCTLYTNNSNRNCAKGKN